MRPTLLTALLLSALAWPTPGSADAIRHTTALYPVGVRTVQMHDATRGRSLDVEVWYPSRGDGPPARYDVRVLGARVATLLSPQRAGRDATPLRGDAPWPIVVFSHGHTSTRLQNVFLTEWLASHGYVVLAPDHAGDTMGDVFGGYGKNARARAAVERPRDLSFVLDEALRASSSATSFLAGMIDPNRAAVAGHSLGGYSALAVSGARFDLARMRKDCPGDRGSRRCGLLRYLPREGDSFTFRDTRFKAAALLAPAGYHRLGTAGVAAIDIPVLVVGGRLDRTTPFTEQRAIYGAVGGQRWITELPRGGHLSVSDVCELIGSIGWPARLLGGAAARDGCGNGFVPVSEAHALTNQVVLAFFDRYVEDDAHATPLLTSLASGAGPVRAAATSSPTVKAPPTL